MKYLPILICYAFLLSIAACKTSNKNEALRSYSILSTLEHQLSQSYIANDRALAYLKVEIKKDGNTREGLERIKRAEYLKQKTAQVIGNIAQIKQQLIEKVGQGLDAKTHRPKQALDISNTQNIMREEAPKLSKKLEAYLQWLLIEYKDLDLPELPPLHKGSQGQSFYETFFADAHLGDVLIMLAHLQSEIMRYQTKAMSRLGGEALYITPSL